MARTYDNRASMAASAGWQNTLGRILDVQAIAVENTTAAKAGVAKWIWPVALAAVALIIGVVFLKKGKP